MALSVFTQGFGGRNSITGAFGGELWILFVFGMSSETFKGF
jgi:hypothetical protein